MTPEEAVKKAVALAGGARAVGEMFGITVQSVGQWKQCPPLRVLVLSQATGGKITPQQLRPDLYPS